MAWQCDGQCCIETKPCQFRSRLFNREMFVIITGNGIYGPFASEKEAISHAKVRYTNRHSWFVRPVEPYE